MAGHLAAAGYELTVYDLDPAVASGVDMVDAAVSGAQWGAQEADLVFMVGGSPESVAHVSLRSCRFLVGCTSMWGRSVLVT